MTGAAPLPDNVTAFHRRAGRIALSAIGEANLDSGDTAASAIDRQH